MVGSALMERRGLSHCRARPMDRLVGYAATQPATLSCFQQPVPTTNEPGGSSEPSFAHPSFEFTAA